MKSFFDSFILKEHKRGILSSRVVDAGTLFTGLYLRIELPLDKEEDMEKNIMLAQVIRGLLTFGLEADNHMLNTGELDVFSKDNKVYYKVRFPGNHFYYFFYQFTVLKHFINENLFLSGSELNFFEKYFAAMVCRGTVRVDLLNLEGLKNYVPDDLLNLDVRISFIFEFDERVVVPGYVDFCLHLLTHSFYKSFCLSLDCLSIEDTLLLPPNNKKIFFSDFENDVEWFLSYYNTYGEVPVLDPDAE